MTSTTKRRIGWMLFLLLLLPMCVTRPVGGFAKPADLREPPACFWVEYDAMASGEAGPFPCVEAFVADAMFVDCQNDAMIRRQTSLLRKCD